MSTIDVLIPYHNPRYHETVQAEPVDGDIWELRQHAVFVPLAPGDRIRINSANALIGIVSLEPQFVYSVFCVLPAGVSFGMAPTEDHPAIKSLAKLEEEWRREAPVTRTTAFSFLISTPARQWFLDRVASHPFVDFIDELRAPGTELDLDDLLANPSFHGDIGPV